MEKMETKSKKTKEPKERNGKIFQWIKGFIILASAITIIFAVMGWLTKYGEDKKEAETRLFTTTEMRVMTEEWVNSPRNEVELYRQQQLSIDAKKEFDTAFIMVKNILTDDIENKVDRIRSRAVRDSLFLVSIKNDSITAKKISDMRDQLKIYNLVNEDIMDLLDEIKQNQNNNN